MFFLFCDVKSVSLLHARCILPVSLVLRFLYSTQCGFIVNEKDDDVFFAPPPA